MLHNNKDTILVDYVTDVGARAFSYQATSSQFGFGRQTQSPLLTISFKLSSLIKLIIRIEELQRSPRPAGEGV